MSKSPILELLLLATAVSSAPVLAQSAQDSAGPANDASAGEMAEGEAQDGIDVDMPGVTVSAIRDRNVQKATTEVVSVLSTDDIARTGEGDIAGALGRVTGLSVVGDGFVFVRGLGDRYSLALLNGSPLPSPEPLRRAVPLDLFPTNIVASSLVQKTYSPSFTGEFGGGVINLTTLSAPKTPFFSASVGMSGDSETTRNLGYDYYGGKYDWTGFDRGNRDTPPALAAFFASGQRMSSGAVDTGAIASEFARTDNVLVQRLDAVPFNGSANISAGNAWLVGDSDARLGLIGTAGFSNGWRTRDILEQTPGSFDLSVIDKDYQRVSTDNHVVANAVLGLSYEFGVDSQLRWTNYYIHDTLKQTSLAAGHENNQRLGADFLEQTTAWYERELLGTQVSVSLPLEPVTIGARASYAQSERDAPYELAIGYQRSNQEASPYGAYFVNRLDNGQAGFASAAFSRLEENVASAGLDLTREFTSRFKATVGFDYARTQRDSERREFQIIAPSTFPSAVGMLRPDFLLGPAVIEQFGIGLVETTESDPAFTAELRTEAAYLQTQAGLGDSFDLSIGARYERAEQWVQPLQVFDTLTNSGAATRLENDYILPGATLTWRLPEGMQLRFNASKTISRPQFRELMFQSYFDPESNRRYRGNPLLVDGEFFNAESRFEWYFAPEERISAAAFYKKIDRPIEAFTGFDDNTPVTSFANAPVATLHGAEVELQKYFALDTWSDSAFWASRRAVVIGNYTFTDSKIGVDPGDTVAVFGTTLQPASNFFRDGSQLTGQSDHLVNLQLGLEQTGNLSQQTILLSYASDRVTSRGAAGLPDIYESPGLRVDVVLRQGLTMFQQEVEAKFEARNLLGRSYKEFQERGGNVVYYNKYDVGTSFVASVTVNF
ncbi:MAG: TonB-dependent receptor [Steroidobacteraceae bacterium]|nr:TonB-dependent receptor [Steroidobacteraceae bacterium]